MTESAVLCFNNSCFSTLRRCLAQLSFHSSKSVFALFDLPSASDEVVFALRFRGATQMSIPHFNCFLRLCVCWNFLSCNPGAVPSRLNREASQHHHKNYPPPLKKSQHHCSVCTNLLSLHAVPPSTHPFHNIQFPFPVYDIRPMRKAFF